MTLLIALAIELRPDASTAQHGLGRNWLCDVLGISTRRSARRIARFFQRNGLRTLAQALLMNSIRITPLKDKRAFTRIFCQEIF
jgi:hypothetical protein